jgi:hypothetical protein
VTCDARVDVHTAYVAVMRRERALDERPDGARHRPPVRTAVHIVLQRSACALGHSVTCSLRASKMMFTRPMILSAIKIAAAVVDEL